MENEMILNAKKTTLEITFKGEIDHQRVLMYREKLIDLIDQHQFSDVIMNFKDVSFIDSSGIGLVLGRYNQLNFEHRKLIITGLNKMSYKLFELSGLFQILPYYKTIEEAIKREE